MTSHGRVAAFDAARGIGTIEDAGGVPHRFHAANIADGSRLIVVGTDAPLTPLQLNRVARRAALGLGRLGSYSGNQSGDLIVSFSTAVADVNTAEQGKPSSISPIANLDIDPLFQGATEAAEEAIVNAMVAAKTMTGIDGTRVYGIPHDELRAVLKRYNRLEASK